MLPAAIKLAHMAEGYHQYFEVLPALTDELRWHNFHLRHEVYARELGWEPRRDDHLESDAFDARSLHTLVRAMDGDRYVAGARLVFTDPCDPDAPLPFEIACGDTLDTGAIAAACSDRSRVGELSRLAVIAQYRRRPGERTRAFSLEEESIRPDRVRLPHLTLGLYFGLVALARWQGLQVLFMLAEPVMARSIAHYGVPVVRIGQSVNHRGVRFPYMMQVEAILAGLSDGVRAFYDSIYEKVVRDLHDVTQ
jgi:N-acyl amino acid synthase of PEP-CTERM/exosortase system